MSRTLHAILMLAVFVAALPSVLLAGTDEYQGDTSIYTGMPPTRSFLPNVLIIVDNSRATLNPAPGFQYRPMLSNGSTNVYPPKVGCTEGVSNPSQGCYAPWDIYSIDNQGNIANLVVLTNTTYSLERLTCNSNSDIIRKTLQDRGTYSGSGTTNFPNISGTGSCDTSPKGAVYVLGNYLRYTQSTTTTTMLPGAPDVCMAPNPTVSLTVPETYCTQSGKTVAECPANKLATRNRTGYYQVKLTHTANDTANKPYYGTSWQTYWNELNPTGSYPSATAWTSGTTYTITGDVQVLNSSNVLVPCSTWINTADVSTQLSQRQIMYNAINQAISSAVGAANFGAMSYGLNNSGGKVLYDVAYLASTTTDGSGVTTVGTPDCSTNSTAPFCQFMAALPGSGKTGTSPLGNANDYGTISSNTGRPQSESVYDAGYYFGATYTGITNDRRIPDAIKNPCNINHVILLTNGFTNGDGNPKLAVIGDADGDHYPDESVYGLGSHYLDDVAKYLKNYYGVTTHTVLAFQERDTLVENAAKDGGGKFYVAYSAEELSAALTKLLASIINEANTSFVAPVVPASTTNRTVSSNKVYLGLFRPQSNAPWHGNVKKYSIGSTEQLLAANGTPATDSFGTFDPDSISYWSLRSDGLISSAKGDINPAGTDPNKAKGDGGQVDAGGVGGKLLKRLETIAAAVKASSPGTWSPTLPSDVTWRNIYTVLDPSLPSGVTSRSLALTDTQNLFATSNSNITPATLGLETESNPARARNNLIRFMHGFTDNPEELTSEAAARSWVFGDVLHSRPLVFNYSKYGDLQENLCAPTETGGMYNSSIVYVGANDGMLHAFRDCDGSELWAFIPPENLKSLKYYMGSLTAGGHPTYLDAAPSAFVHDANGDGIIDPANDKVVLLFGQRRGGGSSDPATREQGAYYAIDVTTPTAPVALWRVGYSSGTEMDEIAETWAQPRIAKVKIDANHFKVVMFVGAGYDTNEDTRFGNTQDFLCDSLTPLASRPQACNGTNPLYGTNVAPSGGTVDGSGTPITSPGSVTADNRLSARGRGIYAIEVADMTRTDANSAFAPTVTGGTTGTVYWSYRPSNNANLDYSFASDLTVVDTDNDGYSDMIYVGDTGGNLWRFDLRDANKSNWFGEIMFRANPGYTGASDPSSGNYTSAADNSSGRKFFYRPIIATVGAPRIYIGTGDREHPLNRAVTDRMYCIIDWKATNPTNSSIVYPIDESKLEDVTINTLQNPDATSTATAAVLNRLGSTPLAPFDADGNFRYGWYIRLDGTDRNNSGDPGEKVLATATVFNGQVFFSTYQLKTGAAASCDAGNLGLSRLYHLDYMTGEAVYNYDVTNDYNAADSPPANERAVGGENGEILKRSDRVRTLGQGIPSGIVTLIDASGKVTLLISSSDKVEASGLPDVKLIMPVYWMQW